MVWRQCSTGRVADSRTPTWLLSSVLPFEVAITIVPAAAGNSPAVSGDRDSSARVSLESCDWPVGFAGVSRKRITQLYSRGDLELGEDPV